MLLLQSSYCTLLVYCLKVLKNTSGTGVGKQPNSAQWLLPHGRKTEFCVKPVSKSFTACHAKVNQHLICSVANY